MTDSSSFLDRSWGEFSQRLYGPSRGDLEFGLDRIERALALEGHPERSAPAILVAGTNGKGSTAAFLAGILQRHGHRVGLFTSPHLIELRERFRIDGAPVDRETARSVGEPLVRAYGRLDADGSADDTGSEGPELSFFELTTLMAASIFERASVDFGIYEVGMGGRLDATNAIEPALSIISTIDRDHQMFLGESIEEIAAEKCGILRSGVPAVVGYQPHRAASRVLSEHLRGETARRAGVDFTIRRETRSLSVCGETVRPFETSHQSDVALWNAATALQASKLLLGETFDFVDAETGLRRTRWPGRYDLRVAEPGRFESSRPVEVLLDAAHNPGAVDALLDQVAGSNFDVAGVVVGGMTDKELGPMFRRLEEGPPVWGAELEGARSAGADGLRAILPDGCLREIAPAATALRRAVREVSLEAEGGVLVFGSTYLIGACLRELGVDVDDLRTYRIR